MKAIERGILEQVIDGTNEPVLLVHVDQPDWPVVLTNAAFRAMADREAAGKPFADVIEALAGREFALEISNAVRANRQLSLPLDRSGREYLLVLKPLPQAGDKPTRYYAVYWRAAGGAESSTASETHQELQKARRRIRDLSRDDPVTGLLNARAFGEVFEHDWAVASRESSKLLVITFRINEFDAYFEVFGRHSTDSCLRRVGQAIRRHLRRASDVIARTGEAAFIVLFHASGEDGARDFAAGISESIRGLGIHHPRAVSSGFVTVSSRVVVVDVGRETRSAQAFLKELLER